MRRKNWINLREKMTRMYESGCSLREVARKIGVSHSTVDKKFSEWGISRRQGEPRQRTLVNDLVGKRIGHLTVLAQDTSKYPTHWICECDCGNRVSILAKKLKRNRTCGCGRRKS